MRNLLVYRYYEIKIVPLVETARRDLPTLFIDVEHVLAQGDRKP